jgi:predicted Zn-ribbon and HTH transcriptional regulator
VNKTRTVIGFFERYVERDLQASRNLECICWKCLACGEFFFTEPVGPPGSCPRCFATRILAPPKAEA